MGIKKKLLNFKECTLNSVIYNAYYNKKIDDNLIYLESRDGLDFTGNILRIVEELSKDEYNDFKIYVHAKKTVHSKINELKKNYNLRIDKIISHEAVATVILEKAKYIFTDSGIRPKYVKRPEQIFINTWHGTPLKLMGINNTAEEHRIANVQHPLLSSDYLLYPNNYMKDIMLNSYMIEKIYSGKILLGGYPRNSVFFDDKRRDELKNMLGFDDDEIFVYMPTFRGILMDRDDEKQKNDIYEYLSQIDLALEDNQILLVKLHVYNESQIDFSKFKHIKAFPIGYEVYDILNLADVLITDYSSVFFDFANTKRKIIIFNYDEDDYCEYRGFYFPLDDLPFPKVSNVNDLVVELNLDKNYDDSEFLDKFCQYDNINACQKLCRHIIKGDNLLKEDTIKNINPNILIFAGALLNNGITSSLINLLNNVDRNNYNFFIAYCQWDDNIIENHEKLFKKIPEGIGFLPFRFDLTPTVSEKLDYNKFFLSDGEFTESLNNLFKRSFDKQYDNINFTIVIDFDGYNKNESLILAKSNVKNAIWVHNDMVQEIEMRNNQNKHVLKELYNHFDNVVVVSSDLIQPTSEISGKESNIKLVHNINNYNKIIENSNKELTLDESTIVYPNDEKLFKVLNSKSIKFITIGKFSPEKGHERLLRLFDKFVCDYPNVKLIIIGGYGDLYDNTIGLISNLDNSDNIVVVKDLSNPLPILKECDLFISSSFYEGWPIVLMEADTLNIPIIATDIVGTQWMKEYNAYIVENSDKGILNAMYEFMQGNIKCLDLDYKEYNKKAIREFYSLIN